MAEFTELIKNFNKIRDYARDFLVYGFKCRNDYTQKSSRSYDNERRRIESYLAGYIRWETSSRGKNLFISTDTNDISENPLFSVWETKSFTTNDCLLHFCLLDILIENPGLTANEAADILQDEYLSHFADYAMPDTMTVRNKLNEYVSIGLLEKQKQGKTLHYYLHKDLLSPDFSEAISRLNPAVQFFENILPGGVLGYFLRRDSGKGEPLFSFRHLFLSHTLDDEVLISIASAISSQRTVKLDNYSKPSSTRYSDTVLPLRIAVNVRHGRRYLFAYNLRSQRFLAYRLDFIKNVTPLEDYPEFEERITELERRLTSAWGVNLRNKETLEHIEMVLSIDEKTESFVVDRLKREGKHGTVEKIAANTFVYRIEVSNTMEMVPWLRTFIGRIASIKGSNEDVIKQFKADIDRMISMYEELQ